MPGHFCVRSLREERGEFLLHATPVQQVGCWVRNRQNGGQSLERGRARRAWSWLLMAALTALLACCAAPVALGQGYGQGPGVWRQPGNVSQPAPDSVTLPAPRYGTYPGGGPAVPVDPQLAPPSDFVSSDPCRPDLWIVSSRSCADPDCPQIAPCCLDYFHQLPDGRLHHGDTMQFQQWLHPGIPLCVVVHGSFSEWRHVRRTTVEIFDWIRRPAPQWPLQMVVFTWPAEGPTNYVVFPYDVTVLGRRSGRYGLYLTQFLSEIPAGHPISIFGHSHGVRGAAAGLHGLAGGMVDGMQIAHMPDSGNRIRMVSAAAAFDHQWFDPGERYSLAMCRLEALLNLRSRHDSTLFFYSLRKPFGHRSLAKAGFMPGDLAALGPLADKTREIDITCLIHTHHFWTQYYNTPEIARRIVPFLYYADAPTAFLEDSAAAMK